MTTQSLTPSNNINPPAATAAIPKRRRTFSRKPLVTDREAVEHLLAKEQGRARSRTLSYEDVVAVAEHGDSCIRTFRDRTILRLKISDLVGSSVALLPGDVPLAYDYPASGTGVILEYRPGAWRLASVARIRCGTSSRGSKPKMRFSLSAAAIEAIAGERIQLPYRALKGDLGSLCEVVSRIGNARFLSESFLAQLLSELQACRLKHDDALSIVTKEHLRREASRHASLAAAASSQSA